MTTHTPPDNCPKCGKRIDAADPIGDDKNAVPAAGDVTVCAGCASFLHWNDEMMLEPIPLAKYMKLDLSTQITLLKARTLIRQMHAAIRAQNN